jgi:cobyrinic acid a,c-diamide synthase
MFLGDSIIMEGKRYPMVGVFPIIFEMGNSPHAHGYTIVEVERENPFYPVGTVLHGHEFHYSAVNRTEEQKSGRTEVTSELPSIRTSEHIYFAFRMKRGHGIKDRMDGICYKNVLATYTHIHALGADEWVVGLINKAREYKLAHEIST